MRCGCVFALLMLVAGFSGCLQGWSDLDEDDLVISWIEHGVGAEDAVGDARERPAHLLFACPFAPCDALPGMDGEPVAFPDLVGVTLVGEDAVDLIIDIGLAILDENFVDLDRGDEVHRLAALEVCLKTSRGQQCLLSRASSSAGGASVESRLLALDNTCNEWHACGWQIQTKIVPGEPGALRLSVPKAYLFGDEEALRIEAVGARALVHGFEPGLPGRHAAATVYHDGDHWHEHRGPFSPALAQVVDEMEMQPLGVDLVRAALPEPDGGPVLVAGPGSNWGGGSPHDHGRYDLRAVLFEEDEETLTVSYELAEWDGFPDNDLHIVALFGTVGGTVYEVGVLKEGGREYGYVGHCITFACSGLYISPGPAHNHGGWQHVIPLEQGEGVLRVHVPWKHLSSIAAGDRLNYMLAMTMHMDMGLYFGGYGDETHGDVHAMGFMDFVEGVRPYVFQHGAGLHDGGHSH
jgi:hypothetical protein